MDTSKGSLDVNNTRNLNVNRAKGLNVLACSKNFIPGGYSFSFSFPRVRQSLKLAVHFSLTGVEIFKVDLSHKVVCLPFAFSMRKEDVYVCIAICTIIDKITFKYTMKKNIEVTV